MKADPPGQTHDAPRSPTSSQRSRVALAAGDGVAIVAFIVLGFMSHRRDLDPVSIVAGSAPFLAGWTLAALSLGAYRRPSPARLAGAWLLGIGGGALVRSLILGHPRGKGLVIFTLISLAVTGALLAVWRAAAGRLLPRRRKVAGG